MKLSILDQSPVREGGTPQQALQETLALAQAAEDWGYHRFWVSEHHNTHSLAGSAPEVLLAALGAATASIRLGSGGVMLPHYSAFKVADYVGNCTQNKRAKTQADQVQDKKQDGGNHGPHLRVYKTVRYSNCRAQIHGA